MGEITDSQIDGQNEQILAFAMRAKEMLDFLNRFYKHLQEMCTEFDNSVLNVNQMNAVLYHYESQMHANFGSDASKKPGVFESHLNDIQLLEEKMQNPFKVMMRWLKFEIYDIEAILEAISKKNAMKQQELLRVQRRD